MFTEVETRQLYDKQEEIMKRKNLVCIRSWSQLTTDYSLFAIQDLSFTFESLSKWFNGYSTDDGQQLYNPWSVANALERNKLRPYWVQSGKANVFVHFLNAFNA